ncbi:unnamed protein product [Ilex paraguariensis]|uniref:Uncharacterized protein n=1 Tax=Ilex paraguariensis TaxID=185542 RepID=A0ABC8TIC2_9AQUA
MRGEKTHRYPDSIPEASLLFLVSSSIYLFLLFLYLSFSSLPHKFTNNQLNLVTQKSSVFRNLKLRNFSWIIWCKERCPNLAFKTCLLCCISSLTCSHRYRHSCPQ